MKLLKDLLLKHIEIIELVYENAILLIFSVMMNR